MKIKSVILAFLVFACLSETFAQPVDKAKLDQFFDQLNTKNKAMGNLVIAKDDTILYNRSIGYCQINGSQKTPLTSFNQIPGRIRYKDVHCYADLSTHR